MVDPDPLGWPVAVACDDITLVVVIDAHRIRRHPPEPDSNKKRATRNAEFCAHVLLSRYSDRVGGFPD